MTDKARLSSAKFGQLAFGSSLSLFQMDGEADFEQLLEPNALSWLARALRVGDQIFFVLGPETDRVVGSVGVVETRKRVGDEPAFVRVQLMNSTRPPKSDLKAA